MDAYRRFAQQFRGDRVWLGLEVDLCADGSLLLAPEDVAGWDLLVGSVHSIPGFAKGLTLPTEAERLFMREVSRLVEHPIQVLAHPFRFFRRAGIPTPTHLYGPLADLLAQHGVAAEVNFHVNVPDPKFIQECVARGVRIALGCDSHDLVETAELAPHLAVLEAAGIERGDLARVLYRPDAEGQR